MSVVKLRGKKGRIEGRSFHRKEELGRSVGGISCYISRTKTRQLALPLEVKSRSTCIAQGHGCSRKVVVAC